MDEVPSSGRRWHQNNLRVFDPIKTRRLINTDANMKNTLLNYALSVAMISTSLASLEEKIAALGKTYESITEEINKLPETDRQKAYDLLREQVSVMGFGIGYYLDGSDAVRAQRGQSWVIRQVYNVFVADQGHLERAIIHTDEGALASKLIGERTEQLCRVFPLSSDIETQETFEFTQYLAHSYRYNPKQVAVAVQAHLTRWQGENRIPALLVLLEYGDRSVQGELDSFTSKRAKRIKTLFRVMVDGGHSK
jgi:hypothetical protein